MGMSNKQLYTTIGLLVLIEIYGGLVFYIADKYGKVFGVVSLSVLLISFFMYMLFNNDKVFHNGKEELK